MGFVKGMMSILFGRGETPRPGSKLEKENSDIMTSQEGVNALLDSQMQKSNCPTEKRV